MLHVLLSKAVLFWFGFWNRNFFLLKEVFPELVIAMLKVLEMVFGIFYKTV